MLELSQRTAVITGAGSGIGRAMAFEAHKRGMHVVLIDQAAERLEELRSQLGAHARAFVADVRKLEEIEAIAGQTADRSIALVCANAGVFRGGYIASQSVEERDLMIDVNIKGVLNTASAFCPLLFKQNALSRLVITSSQAAFLATPRIGVYSATKHAVWAIAETLQHEFTLENRPVRVTMLAPGAVQTALVDTPSTSEGGDVHQDFKASMAARGETPDAVAHLAFEAATAGRFWVFTNGNFKKLVRGRIDRMIDESDDIT